jgi:hypothetical protein
MRNRLTVWPLLPELAVAADRKPSPVRPRPEGATHRQVRAPAGLAVPGAGRPVKAVGRPRAKRAG